MKWPSFSQPSVGVVRRMQSYPRQYRARNSVMRGGTFASLTQIATTLLMLIVLLSLFGHTSMENARIKTGLWLLQLLLALQYAHDLAWYGRLRVSDRLGSSQSRLFEPSSGAGGGRRGPGARGGA